MADVRLEGIGKVYPGGVRAVEQVDLEVADGEFVVLVGPSGCGKSTTLRMVAGLEDVTEGDLWIGDRRVNDVAARDRDIAMVFQNYALYPHLTVRRNLSFGLERRRKALGLSKANISEMVERTAASLGIESLLDRLPKALSGGQRQRVAVGRALVRNPEVFLLDEPLSNLDARLRIEMRTELKMLHRRLKSTMLYVTHDQEEAMSLGDRLVVMHEGRVQQVGSPMEIYRQPANRFVGSFVGTPGMNMLEGSVVDGADGPRFKLNSGAELSCPLTDHRGEAVLGVRPESLRFKSAEENSSGPVGMVEAVERYGDRGDAIIRIEGVKSSLVHRGAAGDMPTEDQKIELALVSGGEGVHLFRSDPAGARIEDSGFPSNSC